MSKQEFIDKLRMALSGRVSASLVEENVAYYEEYINTQIRLGRTEAEVMSSLGNPRLIAKTIITANNGNGTVESSNQESQEYTYGGNGYYTESSGKKYPKVLRLPGWVWALVIIIVLIVIISAVFSLVSALLPIILPVLVVIFFIKLFRDWLN